MEDAMRRIIVIAAITALALAPSASAQRQSPGDRFVGLEVHLTTRVLLYSRGEFPANTVFVGEPIEFVTTLHNNTNQQLSVVDGVPWSRHLAISIGSRIPARTIDGSFQLTERPVTTPITQLAALNRGGISTARARLLSSSRPAVLPPGVYTARATLPPTTFPQVGDQFNDVLNFETSFEVRDPSTSDGDRLDSNLHLAYRAQLDRDLNQQQRFLEEALRINPVSIIALADLGRMWLRRGNCALARSALQRAIDVLTTGGDSELRLGAIERGELLPNLKVRAARCE
jgi:hypothetical protein